MSLKRTVLSAIAAFVMCVPAGAMAGPTVIELFTSQGCSSCPPADALLGELADRDDVVALSLPVDYWDYLGWKDSFGSPQHSARQKSYALTRGDRAVYTPQIVINGKAHIVGSDRAQLRSALKRASNQTMEVGLDVGPDVIEIKIPEKAGKARKGVVWLASISDAEPVEIGRGENAGRRVVYYNVVTRLTRVGEWRGDAATITVNRRDVWSKEANGCAVIIQEDLHDGAGPIIGAALVRE